MAAAAPATADTATPAAAAAASSRLAPAWASPRSRSRFMGEAELYHPAAGGLLVPQCLERRDPRGPDCRQQTRQRRGQDQDRGCEREDQRVDRTHVEQERRERLAE